MTATALEVEIDAPRRGQHPLVGFVLRRTLGAVMALFVASILIFVGVEILPGDAASVVLGRNATPAAVQSLDKQMHLNSPAPTQYWDWLRGFVHGDLGQSAVGLAQG